MTEERYTLSEAQRILGAQQCAQEGHSILWIPMRIEGRDLPDPTYGCMRCSRLCTTRWGWNIESSWPGGCYADVRVLVNRNYCTKPAPHSSLSRGHELIPFPLQWNRELDLGEEYACRHCDVIIHFLSEKGTA